MALELNYSSFDFNTIKQNLITLLENDPIYKDYNFAGSNINTLIEMISGIGDLFNFYINAMADESFIQSAELYENVNKLVELTGYNPSGYTSSSVNVGLSASIDFVRDDDYFEIPKWAEFSVSSTSPEGEEIKYVSVSSLTYIGTSGNDIFDDEIFLIQGVAKTPSAFTGTGEAFQRFEIDDDKAIEEYIDILIDGERWSYVSSMYRDVDATSKVFTTRYNKNQKVELIFGDGIFGVSPSLGSSIAVTYVQTLGEDGAIGANEITGLDDEIKVINNLTGNPIGDPITFIVTQASASSGGRSPLTVDEVKNYAPRAFRTQDRAVSNQDHEDVLLSQFNEYVLQSITLNSDNYFELTGESPTTSGNYYNNVYLYILPRNGKFLTGTLQSQILDFIEDYKMTTINYILKNIDFRNFDIGVTFKSLATTTRTSTEIRSDMEAAITAYFSRSERRIAEEIKYSALWNDLLAISGISSMTLAMSSDLDAGWKYENIQLGSTQFPELNELGITYSGTGE